MAFTLEKSVQAFNEAKQHIPGGVNSPVRSFRGVGGSPPFIASAAGSRMVDIDGNSYIDYVQSWGPMILGHTSPARYQLWSANPAGDRARQADQQSSSFDGIGAYGELRHRGHDERASPGPGLYQTK